MFDLNLSLLWLSNTPNLPAFFYIDYRAIAPSSDAKSRYEPLKLLNVDGDTLTFKVGNIAHISPVSPNQHAKFDKALLLPITIVLIMLYLAK